MKTEDFSLPEAYGGGGPGRRCNPDERFTLKRKYKYDSKGNRIEEEVYNRCNELASKAVHKYDNKGFLVETKSTVRFPGASPSTAERKMLYQRDDKGNLIEFIEEKIYMDNYSDYEFDERGNWIKRKVRNKVVITKNPNESILIEYRKITYY
jgi:hypothetical protein